MMKWEIDVARALCIASPIALIFVDTPDHFIYKYSEKGQNNSALRSTSFCYPKPVCKDGPGALLRRIPCNEMWSMPSRAKV